jgi:hypothetical protein
MCLHLTKQMADASPFSYIHPILNISIYSMAELKSYFWRVVTKVAVFGD